LFDAVVPDGEGFHQPMLVNFPECFVPDGEGFHQPMLVNFPEYTSRYIIRLVNLITNPADFGILCFRFIRRYKLNSS
jgi:hypothetical protein